MFFPEFFAVVYVECCPNFFSIHFSLFSVRINKLVVFRDHLDVSDSTLFFTDDSSEDGDVTGKITMRSRVAITENTPWQNWPCDTQDRPAVWLQAFGKDASTQMHDVLGRFVKAFVNSLGADVPHAAHLSNRKRCPSTARARGCDVPHRFPVPN